MKGWMTGEDIDCMHSDRSALNSIPLLEIRKRRISAQFTFVIRDGGREEHVDLRHGSVVVSTGDLMSIRVTGTSGISLGGSG